MSGPGRGALAPYVRLAPGPDGVRVTGLARATFGHPLGGHPLGGDALGGDALGGASVGGDALGGAPVGGDVLGGAPFGHRPGGPPLAGPPDRAAPPPEGVFAAWEWDGRRLVARNDRYGMCPLFYRADGGALTLSPHVPTLLALGGPAARGPDALDHDALAVFLRLGFFLAEDTWAADVRALPPAATLTWTGGPPRVDSRRPEPPGPAALTRRAAVDGYVDLFRAAVARRLPDRPYDLPLSGGRDSRHLLLELCRQGAPPRLCVSGRKFPPDPGADAEVAAALAERLDLPHRTLPRPRSQFAAERTATARQGLLTLDGGWWLPLLCHLRRHSPLAYDGIGGGELAQNPSLELIRRIPFDPADLPGVADRLLLAGRTGPHAEWLLDARQARLWSRDRARRRLAAELARHAGAAFPLASFFFWNRTRRSIAMAPFGLGSGALAVHAPYLDHALVDHVASVPQRHLIDGTFHDEALARAYPEHARLGFATAVPQRYGTPLVRQRLAYLGRLLAHAPAVRRGWGPGGAGTVARLLASLRGPGGARRANRLLPLADYLLQLQTLTAGGTAPDAAPPPG